MTFVQTLPPQSIPKFYAINCAHSNSSILEAWFSAVQNAKQDFAPTYAHFVANNDMRKAIAYQDLARNKMYEAGDIGEVRMGKNVGPNELIKFYLE